MGAPVDISTPGASYEYDGPAALLVTSKFSPKKKQYVFIYFVLRFLPMRCFVKENSNRKKPPYRFKCYNIDSAQFVVRSCWL